MNGTDEPVALQVTSDGTAHVLAASEGQSTDTDWVFLKYDANGNPDSTWSSQGEEPGVRRFGSLDAVADRPHGMLMDGAVNLYATGTVHPGATGDDIALLKLQPDGQIAWTAFYNGPGNGPDAAAGIQFDPSGRLVVAGTSAGTISGDDFVVLRRETDGTAWSGWPNNGAGVGVRRVDGGTSTSDVAATFAINGIGDVLVAGVGFGAGTAEDFLYASVGVDGVLRWTHRVDGGNSGPDFVRRILFDSSRNLLSIGHATSAGGNDDILVLRHAVAPSASSSTTNYMTLTSGKSVTFSTGVGGSQPLQMQWKKNGVTDPGQTTAARSLNNVSGSMAGAYSLEISNRAGSVTVPVAELAVWQLGVAGNTASFQVHGVEGRNYRVEHIDALSANPVWQTTGTLAAAPGAVVFNDPAATSSRTARFYRLVHLP